MSAPPLHRIVGGLGLATIVSYGGWYYSFGVLIQPISDDTGWTVAQLGAVFAVGQLLAGLSATLGGRLLDRRGGRLTFAIGAAVGGGMLGAAALAPTVLLFGAAYALAAAAVGATGFYHVTMAAARRLRPDRPAKAIGPLTIYGALASPIFLPVTALLVDAFGWRPALGVLALTTAAGLAIAAVLAPDGTARVDPVESGPASLRTAIRRAWADPDARRLTVMFLGYGFGSGLVLTYQVPIMVDVGLPLATAALVAGGRGFMQLTGRIGLDHIVGRFGVRRPLALSAAFAAVSCALLIGSGTLAIAIAFAVLAGASMGSQSPLAGIHSADILPERDLAALMGAVHAAGAAASAAGPLVGGLARTATGSYVPAIILAAAGFCLAGAAVLRTHAGSAARSQATA